MAGQAMGPAIHRKANIVKYVITIDDHCPPIEPREFGSMDEAAEYCIGYVTDEYAENPEPGVASNGQPFLRRDLYAAVGALSSGFAQGGSFRVCFQGEFLLVHVEYDNVDEMMQTLQEVERFAINQDPDGADGLDDLDEYLAEKRAVLSNFGDPTATWTMNVDATRRDPEGTFEGEYDSRYRVFVKDGRVSWSGVVGVITMWAVR